MWVSVPHQPIELGLLLKIPIRLRGNGNVLLLRMEERGHGRVKAAVKSICGFKWGWALSALFPHASCGAASGRVGHPLFLFCHIQAR